MLSLGVDGGGPRKGLDVVLLNEDIQVLDSRRRVASTDLIRQIQLWNPDVIAIDSPPAWATGAERKTETEVRRRGFHLYQTPWQEEKKSHKFYGWMLQGFLAHAPAQEAGYPLFAGGTSVFGQTLEAFPNATAGVLSGGLRTSNLDKKIWRRRILNAHVPDSRCSRGGSGRRRTRSAHRPHVSRGLLLLPWRTARGSHRAPFCKAGSSREGCLSERQSVPHRQLA